MFTVNYEYQYDSSNLSLKVTNLETLSMADWTDDEKQNICLTVYVDSDKMSIAISPKGKLDKNLCTPLIPIDKSTDVFFYLKKMKEIIMANECVVIFSVMSVAGPISHDHVIVTNWSQGINERVIRFIDLPFELFPLDRRIFVNDIAAASYGIISIYENGNLDSLFEPFWETKRKSKMCFDGQTLIYSIGPGNGVSFIVEDKMFTKSSNQTVSDYTKSSSDEDIIKSGKRTNNATIVANINSENNVSNNNDQNIYKYSTTNNSNNKMANGDTNSNSIDLENKHSSSTCNKENDCGNANISRNNCFDKNSFNSRNSNYVTRVVPAEVQHSQVQVQNMTDVEKEFVDFVSQKIYGRQHVPDWEDVCCYRGLEFAYALLKQKNEDKQTNATNNRGAADEERRNEENKGLKYHEIRNLAMNGDEIAFEAFRIHYRMIIRSIQSLCLALACRRIILISIAQVHNTPIVNKMKDELSKLFMNLSRSEWFENIPVYGQTKMCTFALHGGFYLGNIHVEKVIAEDEMNEDEII